MGFFSLIQFVYRCLPTSRNRVSFDYNKCNEIKRNYQRKLIRVSQAICLTQSNQINWNAAFVVEESESVKYFYLKTSAIITRTQIQVQ